MAYQSRKTILPKLKVTPIDKFYFGSDRNAKYYFQINKFNDEIFFGFCKEKQAVMDKLKGVNTFNVPMWLWGWLLNGIDRLLTIVPRNDKCMFI